MTVPDVIDLYPRVPAGTPVLDPVATLPSDHTLRAPRPADDEAVLRVLLARDVADLGYPDFTLEDLRADWATPGFALERDAWVAERPGGEVVASALLLGDDALIHVHPDACGHGIGSALRLRAEERAGERGTAVCASSSRPATRPPHRCCWRRATGRCGTTSACGSRSRRLPGTPATRYGRSTATRTRSPFTSSCRRACRRSRATSPSRSRCGAASGSRSSAADPALWLLLEDDEGLAGAALGERWGDGVG